MQSICLFHNGNLRIVELYKNKFNDLKFCGNLAEAEDTPATGCLWEVCFADATFHNLLTASKLGVKIVRHITDYQDDMKHLLPECERFEYSQWLQNCVTNNLSLANEVVSEFSIDNKTKNATIVITTGRTANIHLQEIYRRQGNAAYESSKKLDAPFFEAQDSVFLWRLDQWGCLTSTWIAQQTQYTKAHRVEGDPLFDFEKTAPIDINWIETDWSNLCKLTLDQALLSKYVCNRPVSHTTTEFVTANFETIQKPLVYNKQELIPNYQEVKVWYENSDIAKNLTVVYNNVITHLTPWSSQ